jgi:hypothetical protein
LYLDRSNHQLLEKEHEREKYGKKIRSIDWRHSSSRRDFLTGLGLGIPAYRKIPGPGPPGITPSHDPPLRKIDDILTYLQRADDPTDRKPNGKAGFPTCL